MSRLNLHILSTLRTLAATPGFAASGLTIADTAEARTLGLTPETAPVCPHDDTELICPYCGGDNVNTDTHVCLTCREPIAFVRRCIECEEDVTAFWPYKSLAAYQRAGGK